MGGNMFFKIFYNSSECNGGSHYILQRHPCYSNNGCML